MPIFKRKKEKKYEKGFTQHEAGFTRHTAGPVRRQAGFSLIETFVAITILLTAVVAPLSLAQQSLNAAKTTKDQMTAYFLAQEAMEHIRNVRDSNGLASNYWLQDISKCSTNGCVVDSFAYVDSFAETIETCAGNTGCDNVNIYFYPELEVYSYPETFGVNEPIEISQFARRVEVELIGDEEAAIDEAAITVTVSWGTALRPQKVVIRENIFNWQ